MKILFAIKSCQRDQQTGCHQAIRDTWGKGYDVRFFVGGGDGWFDKDEVHLPGLDDGYWELTPKTKAICAYTVEHNYDFVYLCDTDTYLHVPTLLDSGFERYDFSGGHLCHGEYGCQLGKPYPRWVSPRGGVCDPFYAYMSGGVGFFLSKRSAKVIAETAYYHHSEDVWVGQVLGPFIERGDLTAGVLKGLEGSGAWHLNCGFYGGGHTSRLSPAEAIRRKHDELRRIE